jgi:hypothetical protein
MLAEKFFLLLEMLRSHTQLDGSLRVVSNSPHVPTKLPPNSSACLRINARVGASVERPGRRLGEKI